MKTEGAQSEISAWRIAAPRGCKFELQDRDEAFAFGGIKPGDAMLLMDETGDFAWCGVPRVCVCSRNLVRGRQPLS